MNDTRERQRLHALFADLDRIAADPSHQTPEMKQEIAQLRARLHDFERQLSEINEDKTARAAPRAAPFAKDQIGYSYSNNHLESVTDLAFSSPIQMNVFATKFAVGDQAVGEMQIIPSDDEALSADDINLVNGIIERAALQIQNLRLLATTERSRLEAEAATRQFIHKSWDSYLDAIHQNERIGFTYDLTSVSPLPESLQPNGGIQAPVKILDEPVGTLYVEPASSRQMTDADRALINSVASQVAQQVESLRLLADASRARNEAEVAIRRLSSDNWDRFKAGRADENLGFIYDSLQVKPLLQEQLPPDIVLTQPLTVSGENIGQLAVAGITNTSDETAGLVATIAAQTSIHLETLRLTEELQTRARELKELDRLKSAFLANMSHELRTPLNSILGFTDVMLEELDGPLTENMSNDLRLIQKNGQHLLHLINDVLDMAKIESGRMNLNPEIFKVHSVLEEVTSITSTLASEKNVALFIDESSDQEIEIYADSTRLRQVMINLVNNSIKFTDVGKIIICARPMEGGRVKITVQDTGIGIPPDKLEAVFQEFTQVDTSTTRKAGGTGLGLPISRRLVEMHGGRLWAESTGLPGDGATFHVELPLEARITDVIEKQVRPNVVS